jgi:hypothetical protein
MAITKQQVVQILLAGIVLILIFVFLYLIKIKRLVDEMLYDSYNTQRDSGFKEPKEVTKVPEYSGIDFERNYSREELRNAYRNRVNQLNAEVEKLNKVEKLLKKCQ